MVYRNDGITEKITLNRTYLVLYIGNTYRLKVKVCTKEGTTKVAHWSSSDPAVLSVDAHTGIVRAKKAGMAYVFIDSLSIKANSDYDFVDVFADKGIIGTRADQRVEFQRMISSNMR